MPDSHKNFAYSTVATAPSPADTGTSLVVQAGEGALFPAVPFNATVWPAGVQPLSSNAEIVRVTNITTDTFTITRQQESSSARSILVGDQIAATITALTLTDAESGGSLDAAYDFGGGGYGRIITADAGAVELRHTSNFTMLATRDPGDAVDRFALSRDGDMSWGSGAGAADVVLSRVAANQLALAAGDSLSVQYIRDTAGSMRITTAAASPHVTLSDHVQIDGSLGVGGKAPSTAAWIALPATLATAAMVHTGISMSSDLTMSGTMAIAYALRGVFKVYAARPANSSNNSVMGLEFIALAGCTTPYIHTFQNLFAIRCGLYMHRASGTLNITDAAGIDVVAIQNMGTGGTITRLSGIYVHQQGVAVATTVYGIAIENVTLGTNKYVFEAGGTIGTLPYQRIIGSWAPAINTKETALYIAASNNDNPITTTLRHLQWIDPGAGGANFAGGERVCILV